MLQVIRYEDLRDFVLIGDSKLLSEPNRRALLAAGVGYLAPVARTPELDAAFLAIPPEERHEMSTSLSAFVAREWTWERTAERLLTVATR